MCFSATASFSVAAVTAAIGVAVLRRVREPRELPLAIVPLLFAAQQAIEGVVWLRLADGGGGEVGALSFAFLVFAEVLWPTYAAVAVLLVEPDPRRRQAMAGIAAIGAVLSLGLLIGLIDVPPLAIIRGDSIDYRGYTDALSWQQLPYLACTILPLLLCSHRTIQLFGAVVLAGFLVAAWIYLESFVSVWCFFAASSSALLYVQFRRTA